MCRVPSNQSPVSPRGPSRCRSRGRLPAEPNSASLQTVAGSGSQLALARASPVLPLFCVLLSSRHVFVGAKFTNVRIFTEETWQTATPRHREFANIAGRCDVCKRTSGAQNAQTVVFGCAEDGAGVWIQAVAWLCDRGEVTTPLWAAYT